jgi:hypothetical protein
MHGPINVKSPNNTSKWQMGFNSAFKGLRKPSYRVSTSYVFQWVLIQIIMVILPWFGLLKLNICVAAEPNVIINHH